MAKAMMKKTEDLDDQEAQRDQVMQMLGAMKYAEYWQSQTEGHIMQILTDIEERKGFIAAGYMSMKAFLEGTGLKSVRTYYRHRELFLKEGPEQYDLFESLNVPHASRKLLAPGDVTIDGDVAIVGDVRIDLASGGVGVKKLVERLVKDKIAAEKSNAKLEGYKAKYDELKAKVDEAAEKPEYVVAYMNAVEALLVFIAEVNDLPGEVKANRAAGDLAHIGELMDQLSRAYGEGGSTRQPAPAMFVSLDGDNF